MSSSAKVIDLVGVEESKKKKLIDLSQDSEDEGQIEKKVKVYNKVSEGKVLILRGGNILEADERWIVHQSNCVSRGARGLAKVLFERFPEANIYRRRCSNSIPGTIDITYTQDRYIVALFAQRGPGSNYYGDDTKKNRLIWFEQCLDKLGVAIHNTSKDDNKSTLAMPYNIGCGLAGGKWQDYKPKILQFARKYFIRVHLYDLYNNAPPSETSGF